MNPPVLFGVPGNPTPLSMTSRNTWVSNVKGVESKGTCWIVGSMWSDRAMVWDANNSTTSVGEKFPPSSMRAKILSRGSWGSGTNPSGAGAVAFGRPSLKSNRGAPGQLVMATAAANWIRSPAVISCFERNGLRALTPSEIPRLAWKLGSTLGKTIGEPSAPPPDGRP